MEDFTDSTGYGGRLGDFAVDTLYSEIGRLIKGFMMSTKE